jgi:hypothetical protein
MSSSANHYHQRQQQEREISSDVINLASVVGPSPSAFDGGQTSDSLPPAIITSQQDNDTNQNPLLSDILGDVGGQSSSSAGVSLSPLDALMDAWLL